MAAAFHMPHSAKLCLRNYCDTPRDSPQKKGQSSPGSTTHHMISEVFFYVYIYIYIYIMYYILYIKPKSSRVGTLTVRAVHKQLTPSVYEWRWITTKPSLTGC